VQVFLVTNDSFEAAYDYLASLSSSVPCLMDSSFEMLNGYAPSEFGESVAPYPRQVVIDRDGYITYLNTEIDTAELRDAIDEALLK